MQDRVDLDAIIAGIREEARRPEYQVSGAEPPLPLGELAPRRPPLLPPEGLAGTAPEPPAAAAHFDDLLLITDRELFIEAAYRRLLGRSADGVGMLDYGDKLRRGYGQTFVIAALSASTEARARDLRLPGMGLSALPYNAWRVLRRLGMDPAGRWLNGAYNGWRHLRLSSSGRLASQITRADNLLAQQLRQELQQQAEGLQQPLSLLQDGLNQLRADSTALAAKLQDCRAMAEHRLDAQQASLDEQAVSLDEQAVSLDEQAASLTAARQEISARVSSLRTDHQILQATVKAQQLLLQPDDDEAPAALPEPAVDATLQARIDGYYLAFEEMHRGTEADIRAGQASYLPYLQRLPAALRQLPVLDLGCGRGEWLCLLQEQGLTALGVDLNPAMVVHCRNQGLQVRQGDAVAALAACAPHSLAAVSAFHLIEHLPFNTLFRLLEEAARVLAPGGLLILETPNPENVLVGSHTFYHDFSHRNPITPSALDFLAGYNGFVDREFLRLNPYPADAYIQETTLAAERLNGHLYGPQDLGLVARRPMPVAASGGAESAGP